MFDTIIIGGGIGGLQAAIQLGRSLHRVMVVDQKSGRSILAKNYRNILGYPDGVSGEHLRRMGELHAVGLGVQFLTGHAERLTQNQEGLFEVWVRGRTESLLAKTIVLSTGITDPLPEIPGLMDCLGESVFICPDCDGYEVVNRKTAVIGSGPQAATLAEILQYFTNRLVVVNHAKTSVDPQTLKKLEAAEIPYYEEEIASILQANGQIQGIMLQNGMLIECEKGFLSFAGAQTNTDIIKNFPVQFIKNGHVQVNPRTQETDYPGIWAVGDIVPHAQQVSIAMGDGSKAAIWIHKRLIGITKPEKKVLVHN